jgi:hypothetical protein
VTEHNEQYNCSVRETQVPEAAGKARSAGFARDSAVHAAKHSGRVFGWQEEILVLTNAQLPSRIVSTFRWIIDVSKPDGVCVTWGKVFGMHRGVH